MTRLPPLRVHAASLAQWAAIGVMILLPPILVGCAQKGTMAHPSTRIGAIAAGGHHTCAITEGGGVKCWGGNAYGQLGDGSASQRSSPVDVVGLTSGVKAITTGGPYTCALTTAGGVKCWGRNFAGQLGDGTDESHNTPVQVVGLTSGVTAIAGGGHHTCALIEAGAVTCWGSNDRGQLGNGMKLDQPTPVAVVGLTTGIRSIATGGHHTCAITEAGGVKCWGGNAYGQLGDGSTSHRNTPVDVVGLTSGVRAITAGGFHTCVLTDAGSVKCWGDNSQGQLGNGPQPTSTVPVNVAGLLQGVTMITAGVGSVRELEAYVGAHTCALITTGGVKCWGDNDDGQLGEGKPVDRDTPVDVLGLTGGAKGIAAGAHHSCALTTAGQVKCWGDNSQGQLGNGTTTDSPIPVDVVTIRFYQSSSPESFTQQFQ